MKLSFEFIHADYVGSRNEHNVKFGVFNDGESHRPKVVV